jgi:hypothetical protein
MILKINKVIYLMLLERWFLMQNPPLQLTLENENLQKIIISPDKLIKNSNSTIALDNWIKLPVN